MTSRTVRISSHYIVAEILAFPFSSESSFHTALTELDTKFGDDGSKALWRAAERQILGAVPSMSLDEFVGQRDKLWIGDPERSRASIPMLDILRGGAEIFLEHGKPRLRRDDFVGHSECGEQHARALWKWIQLSLPVELLLAASKSEVSRVELLSPSLSGHLSDMGFAEVHLHFGAGLDFPSFWALTCNQLLVPECGHGVFQSPGADFEEGTHMGGWLLRACVVRYLLAAFLERRTEGASFQQYLDDATRTLMNELGIVTASLVRDVVREVKLGRFVEPEPASLFHGIQRSFIALRRLWQPSDAMGADARHRTDPIGDWLDEVECPIDVELQFLRRAFTYVDDARRRKGDDLFEQLLWQTVRLRCSLFRHVVQRPMTPGLMWFIRTFERMRAGKSNLAWDDALAFAARTSGADAGLSSFEVRTGPGIESGESLELLGTLDRMVSDPELAFETGLVLHFSRDRGGGMREGRPGGYGCDSHADPDMKNGAYGARFGGWYREQRVRALSLASVIRNFPETLEILRGLDVCADEAGVPTWVVKPIISYVRAVANSAARKRAQETRELLRFNMTAHAGEDWVHLLSGIRRMHEAMVHFEMQAGDRLGHGLALGVDAARWSADIGPVPMSVEDRFFDLVWAWRRVSEGAGPRSTGLETEIRRLFEDMFIDEAQKGKDHGLDAWRASQFVDCLYDAEVLRRIHYPDVTLTDSQALSLDWLVSRFLTDSRVFRRGRRIIYVDPAREADLILQLQRDLHLEVGRRGLVVEVNPSSNFLTSQLASLREHPAWQLRSPRNNSGLPRIAVVIGSDDPLTFATTLREEYQLMHDALVLEGLTTEEADQWIEDARQNGVKHRWTRPSKERKARHQQQKVESPTRRFEYDRADDDVQLPP